MTKAGQVEGDLTTWLIREWKKIGQITTEIDVGYLKTGAPTRIGVITKATLQAYENTKELSQAIEDMLDEHKKWHAGRLRYEIVFWGGEHGTTALATKNVERQGQGEPEEPIHIGKDEVLAMYMREARKDRELTISTLQKQIETLERRLDRQYGIIDTAMARYPELLDLMNKLADTEVEREIRRRQANRIEGIKDRAVANIPQLVTWVTGGAVNLLGMGSPTTGPNGEPLKASEIMGQVEAPLIELLESLGEKSDAHNQIGKLLTEKEQGLLMQIAMLVQQYKQSKAAESKDKEIGVKEKKDNGQPSPS